jgi:hypothetical protein
MTRCYDHKELHGGAAFPLIGEGLFLFTGPDAEVIGVNLPSIQFARFEQPVPSSTWYFEHNFGSMPLAQVYDLSGSIINESVHVNVTPTSVTISTDNDARMSGFVTLLSAGASGTSGSGSSEPEGTQGAITNIDGGMF